MTARIWYSIESNSSWLVLLFLSCFIQWVAIITSCWIDQKPIFQTHYYAWSPLFLPYLPCLLLWVAIIPSFLNWPENLQWIHKKFIWPQWANEPKSHYYYGIPLLKKFQLWSFKPNLQPIKNFAKNDKILKAVCCALGSTPWGMC